MVACDGIGEQPAHVAVRIDRKLCAGRGVVDQLATL
jgi:hypothetical protein